MTDCWSQKTTGLVVLRDKVELLVGFLQEEDDIGQDDDRHQLNFTPSVIQVSDSFEPVYKILYYITLN